MLSAEVKGWAYGIPGRYGRIISTIGAKMAAVVPHKPNTKIPHILEK